MEQLLPFILAFFGGVFGTAIGGASAFILFGLMAMIGIATLVTTGDPTFLEGVALNPVFAPFATFIGAFAAAAYTAKLSREGKLQNADGSEAEPFAGGNIFAPLLPFKNISILLVGGVFGVIGFGLLVLLDDIIGLPADNIGVAVLLGGILVRLVFGDGDFQSQLPPKVQKRHMITQNLGFNVLWAFSLSVLMATVIGVIQQPLFGFALGAFSLIFIAAGIVDFPMIHHIAFIAGLAMQVTGNIWIAGIFGVIAMLLGDTIGVVSNVQTKSHIDPPAGAIAILSLILLGLF